MGLAFNLDHTHHNPINHVDRLTIFVTIELLIIGAHLVLVNHLLLIIRQLLGLLLVVTVVLIIVVDSCGLLVLVERLLVLGSILYVLIISGGGSNSGIRDQLCAFKWREISRLRLLLRALIGLERTLALLNEVLNEVIWLGAMSGHSLLHL